MLKFLNFSAKFIIIFFVSIIFFVFSTLWYFSVGLPDYKKLSNYQPPISSRVYSEDNKLIAEYALEKRLFIPFESIPDKVVNAFLSAEDKNFFSHPGIDAKGILRAIVKNIKNIAYYIIPVNFEIDGSFIGYIKFKRAVSLSNKMLNFDKESIKVVKGNSTGAIKVKGTLTIVGLPDEFF